MPISVMPIRVLVQELTKWADDIERGEIEDAKFRAEHIKRVAELLAIDPEFKRIFDDNKRDCESNDPRAALECLSAFLHAVADAVTPGRFRANASNDSTTY